jgi:hypothetical protein
MLTPSLRNNAALAGLLLAVSFSAAHAATPGKSAEKLPASKVQGVSLKSDPALPSVPEEASNPYAGVKVHPVSTHDYNRLVFSEPVARIFVSDEKALVDAPEYLAGNTSALLLFNKNPSKRPVQVLVNFKSGGSAVLYVRPGDVPGAVLQVENVEGGSGDKPKASSAADAAAAAVAGGGTPHDGALRVLKGLVQGVVPEGYQPLPLPAPTHFDRYTVNPELAATDGFRSVYVFRLVAQPGKVSVISPNQFYRPGVSTVMVDGDRLDDANPRRVFLVEETSYGR